MDPDVWTGLAAAVVVGITIGVEVEGAVCMVMVLGFAGVWIWG